jgi:hypothetical protein
MRDVRGVRYLYNARGKRTAVLIDLEANAALWEDLFDVALARSRASEPTERWATVRRRLERAGRLKPRLKPLPKSRRKSPNRGNGS